MLVYARNLTLIERIALLERFDWNESYYGAMYEEFKLAVVYFIAYD